VLMCFLCYIILVKVNDLLIALINTLKICLQEAILNWTLFNDVSIPFSSK